MCRLLLLLIMHVDVGARLFDLLLSAHCIRYWLLNAFIAWLASSNDDMQQHPLLKGPIVTAQLDSLLPLLHVTTTFR